MSQEGKTKLHSEGFNLYKSKIEELNLPPEEEERVKSLFHNYSDGIQSVGSSNSNTREEFKQFIFFPGNVFVLDANDMIIYQNRSFNNLYISSGKSFGGEFTDVVLTQIHAVKKKVSDSQDSQDLCIPDKYGRYYDCRIAVYDADRQLSLIFLSQARHKRIIEEAKEEINQQAIDIIKQSRLLVKFYNYEKGEFVQVDSGEDSQNEHKQSPENLYLEPMSNPSVSLKKKMKEALLKRQTRIASSVNENKTLQSKKQVIIPLSEKSVCVVSNYNTDKWQGVSVEELVGKYKLIANSLIDLFFILDNELKFTFIAPSVEPALEYNYFELLGCDFDSLIPKWSGNTLKKNLDTVGPLPRNDKNPQKFKIQLSSKYGALKWYECQVTSICNEENQLQGYNGICRDITERLKYEEALMQAKSKAEESDKLKSAFLANMSHEIRTPLNGIIGFSTMINNKKLTQDKKELYAQYIVSSSKQLLALINDIIDISKIEAQQLSILKTSVELDKLFSELRDIIEVERNRMGKIEVQLVLRGTDKLTLFTDEVRIKQVLVNLLYNALKFTRKGIIEFGYKLNKSNTKVLFFVKDTGNGIPKEIQRAVFERFCQGDAEKQAKVSGTGLGLAISKGIVDLLGGDIGLESNVGKGSEFYFTLPYCI